MDISTAITSSRQRYTALLNIASAAEINNGWCEEFASDVANSVPTLPNHCCAIIGSEELMMGEDGDLCGCDRWDWDLLQKHWAMKAPRNLSPEQIDSLSFPPHVWVTDGERHYDAECPEGVANFFDLPFFARVIQASRVH